MSTKLYEPPYSNTGVTHTLNHEFDIENKGQINNLNQLVLIDWLQFTIHYGPESMLYAEKRDNLFYVSNVYIEKRIYDLFYDLFGITDLVYENYGHNGYSASYSYKNIHAYISNNMSMGINFEISGRGCRDIEELGIDFYSLFMKLKLYNAKYNRIDLSIDDFTDRYFTLKKISKYLNKGLVVSKIRSFITINSGIVKDCDLLGSTVQFGSKSSLVHITFYDKLKERRANNYEVNSDIKFWTRCEVRFRHDKADDVIEYLIISHNDINSIVKGTLIDYLRFIDKGNDTNKWRSKTAKWWSDYLDNISSIKLAPIHFESSIQRKKVWLNESVSKSQLQVLLSTMDNIYLDELSSEFLLKMLKHGVSKLKDKDLKLINDSRVEQGFLPLTMEEIKSYSRDIKNVLICGDRNYLE